ncbi:hypothetical protein BDB00DRAFT_846457 [Zychaea mexicana]|uniref:uncharacterized protein n=1 Tax=Zychaea mexicana TaxID=64656 RepID=UPI0022FE0BCD|nr:uncharacterized protein BDB00DRAFT_846457 [Zychaea mexicana]KAI9488867.1 hypothetical protein BDB00DRAFT_846457 [Zychaea mexicana]
MQDIIVGITKNRSKSMETEFYSQHSRRVARSVFARMARAEKSLPGYYGPRGMQIIMDSANTAPMPPLQFVQQILVRETAARLNQEDKNVSYDEALEFMKKSAKFGSAVNPTMDSDESESSDE